MPAPGGSRVGFERYAVRIPRSALVLGDKVGSGAQGSLHAVIGVPPAPGMDLPEKVVYKEFFAQTRVSGPSLEGLCGFRSGLDGNERKVIDSMTVWPCVVVDDGSGRASGFLMRRLDDRFFQRIETTEGTERIPREIQQLFQAEAIGRKNLGETANRVERLALGREVAFILGFLHKRDFVFGDLSYKNAVFCIRPRPSVVLLDCDAVRKLGEAPAVPQLHSPGWKPPEGGAQSKATDRYKLGLFVLRCMTPGVNAQNRDPSKAAGELDSEGMSLLRRSLGEDPELRTTGREWVAYLNRAMAAAGGVRSRSGTAPAPRPTETVRRPSRADALAGLG